MIQSFKKLVEFKFYVQLFSLSDLYPRFLNIIIKPYNGKHVKFWFGPILVFIPRTPEDVKIILTSEKSQEKALMFYDPYFKHGLITMNAKQSRLHRKAINPVFSPQRLKTYVPIINENMRNFLEKFDSGLKCKENQCFDMLGPSMDFALQTTLLTLFGNGECDGESRKKYMECEEGQVLFQRSAGGSFFS